jgi:Holliday junction resolvase RusA-like endonuclease
MKAKLPLFVTIPRKKGDRKWICNLNNYRNTHYITLNKVKQIYKEYVQAAWYMENEDMPKPPLILIYTVYPATNRIFDIANVCTVIDKFTCDALVELGVITDDNHKVVAAVNYRIGKVDKENPRVELEIEEWR